MYERQGFFVDNQIVAPAGPDVLEVICPSTEEVAGRLPAATPSDLDRAVASARDAFDRGPWPRTGIAERIAVVEAALTILEGQLPEIADLVTAEMGIPITGQRGLTVAGGPAAGRLMVENARRAQLVELREGPSPALVIQEPVGVVGAIAPWNGPLNLALNKAVPALLAGCAVVYKPALETPLDAYYMGEAFRAAGLPDGALNIVPAGREVGEHLVRHPGIDKISFTGSTAAGRRIGAICGEQVKRVGLELGGKSAAIVLSDADLDVTTAGLAAGVFGNCGQMCMGLTRAVVPRALHDEIVERLAAAAAGLVIGDPFDPDTTLGPLVAERQRARVEGYIAIGESEGAKLAAGGRRPAHLDRGWCIEPTVFAGVENGMRIAREEIFGPVTAVIPYDTEDEAIAIANDSEYGLHGAVFTTDDDRALEVAKRVRAGTFSVNGFMVNRDAPFGGMKASGIGREFGREGFESYLELKTVNIPQSIAARFE
jgi:acyl-CoA reductase-like NAD-dependent aldehyde dehydrogenase